jgi:hypothetical protein
MSLVVCSRMADYESLFLKLNLNRAILLQSLSRDQVESYLTQFEVDLLTLKSTLQRDTNLQELAHSPLMLSIMVLAYRGLTPEKLPQFDSIEAQRRHLFEVYVQQIFARRNVSQTYCANRTCHWLGWLGAGMMKHSQTTYPLERLQLTWLLPRQRLIYQELI